MHASHRPREPYDITLDLNPCLSQTVTLTYHNTLHANASAAAASATATTSGAAARRRRLGWFHNIAEHVDHDVHDAAHDVTHDVTDAAKAVTGDMSVNHQFSLKSFGWTPPASIHVGPVDAKGSYAKLAVGVHFEMEMKDYTVESLEVAAVLSADLKAQAGATFSDGVTRSYTQSLMDDVNLGSITFSIGPVRALTRTRAHAPAPHTWHTLLGVPLSA